MKHIFKEIPKAPHYYGHINHAYTGTTLCGKEDVPWDDSEGAIFVCSPEDYRYIMFVDCSDCLSDPRILLYLFSHIQ